MMRPAMLSLLVLARAALARETVQFGAEAAASAEVTFVDKPSAVLSLNRFTFHGNVLKPIGENSADHWVVMFCPPWWEMCQRMYEPYASMSGEWQGKLNSALMTLDVRFAKVDCATDKPLCNDQAVEGYPTVHHYNDGKRVATWNGGRQNDPERLTKWLKGQFEPLASAAKKEQYLASQRHEPTLSGVIDSGKKTLRQLSPGEYSLDAFLIIGILALVARTVVENPMVWQTHGRKSRLDAVSSFCTPQMESALETRTGVARFLPREWASDGQSMEL